MSDVKLERYQSVSGPCYRIMETVSDREVCLTLDGVRELREMLASEAMDDPRPEAATAAVNARLRAAFDDKENQLAAIDEAALDWDADLTCAGIAVERYRAKLTAAMYGEP